MRLRPASLLVVSIACLAQTPATYRVGGVVVNSVTGAPLAKTRITLASESAAGEQTSMVTAADGRFGFDVAEGRYSLGAERHGQDRQLYGQRTLRSSFAVAVVAGPGERTDQLTFRMIPNSSLSGQIVDESGEPVPGAMVQLFRSAVYSGRRRVSRYGYAYSDDRGEYRFSRLPSGDYTLAASGQPWYSRGRGYPVYMGTTKFPTTAFPLTFYSNSRDWQGASVIRLQAGDDATANLSLIATPGHQLIVKCEPAIGTTRVSLVSDSFMGADSLAKIEYVHCPETELGIIAPGSYLLRSWRGAGVNSNPLAARQRVEISSSDVAVKMDFKPAPVVSGKMQLGDLNPDRVVVLLRPEGDGGMSLTRTVGADGSFTFPNVVPGTYRLVVVEPAGVWAQQVLADGKRPVGGTFEVTEDHAPELTLTPRRGLTHLTGKALKDGHPAAGLLVVLAPREPSTDWGDYAVDKSNSDGSFEMKSVRPGNYFLLAVDMDDLEYTNRPAIQRYIERAKLLEIEAGRDYKEEITAQ